MKSNLNGDKYACKSIPKKCVTHLDSLLTEIQTLRMLRHPNILEIYEVYEGEHSYNLILEYLQGGSLRNYRNLKPQSVRDIMKVGGITPIHSRTSSKPSTTSTP